MLGIWVGLSSCRQKSIMTLGIQKTYLGPFAVSPGHSGNCQHSGWGVGKYGFPIEVMKFRINDSMALNSERLHFRIQVRDFHLVILFRVKGLSKASCS